LAGRIEQPSWLPRSPSFLGSAGVMVGEDLGDDSGDALAGWDVQEFVGTVRI
jgi:hypothetical protein